MSPTPYRNDEDREPGRGASTAGVVIGFIFLLPGACSLLGSFFVFQSRTYWESPLLVIWLLGLVIGAFGVVLIVHSARRPGGDRSVS